MQTALVIALSLHVLSSVFWAGSSFTLARTGGAGGEQLIGPQMGAAAVTILTGAYLGHSVHAGMFGTAEQILGSGRSPRWLPPRFRARSAAARSEACATARPMRLMRARASPRPSASRPCCLR